MDADRGLRSCGLVFAPSVDVSVQSSHVDRWASSTVVIHPANASTSFGTDFTIWVSVGTAELVSIVWASLEYPVLATIEMKSSSYSCFASFFCKYSSTNSGES